MTDDGLSEFLYTHTGLFPCTPLSNQAKRIGSKNYSIWLENGLGAGKNKEIRSALAELCVRLVIVFGQVCTPPLHSVFFSTILAISVKMGKKSNLQLDSGIEQNVSF